MRLYRIWNCKTDSYGPPFLLTREEAAAMSATQPSHFILEEAEPMNVNDVEKVPEASGCKLEAIFTRQHELQEEYALIERKKNIGYGILSFKGAKGYTYNIDDHRVQYLIKDFFWRVTEELAEAAEVLSEPRHYTHGIEELADALHFMIESCIISGREPKHIYPNGLPGVIEDKLDIIWEGLPTRVIAQGQCLSIDDITKLGFRVVVSMGLAANCLKNKPWKTTQMLTDKKQFYSYQKRALLYLFEFMKAAGLSAQDTYEIYMKKSEVNKFRIRSGY